MERCHLATDESVSGSASSIAHRKHVSAICSSVACADTITRSFTLNPTPSAPIPLRLVFLSHHTMNPVHVGPSSASADRLW